MSAPSVGPLKRLHRAVEFGHFTRLVLFSAVIGAVAGVIAAGFKWLTGSVAELCFHDPTGILGEGADGLSSGWWLLLAIPIAGGLVTGLIVYTLAPEAEGHGTDSVIHAYHRLKGVVRKRVILVKTLASSITIGTGGSAGMEGPVAQAGAGVGSSLAKALKLSDQDRRIFLLAGGSAGIGAMFCSPLGGALFMPEVLYKKPEFEGESIIPCIISSIFAFATMTSISGLHRAVDIAPGLLAKLSFDHNSELAIYLVLGILCALVGWVYTHVFYGVHAAFGRMSRVPKILRPAIGGLLLGCVALALAPYAGSNGIFFGGYNLMRAAIAGQLAIPILLALLFAKILATSFTISSGGSGGVFAPGLAIGALLGAAVGQGARELFPLLDLNPANYALVGMGGFFAGVAKVPIASIILVSEMTGSYALLAPLMLVSVVHMLLSGRWTMYRAQVPAQIDSPAHAGDFVVDVLESLKVADVIGEARIPTLVPADVTLRGAMKIVADSHETHFPVVENERLVGIFSLTDLRRVFLEDVIEDMIIVRDFMIDRVVTTRMTDSLNDVLRGMTRSNVNVLPVVDAQDPGRVIALLERGAIGRAYDEKLQALKSGVEESK
jgi:CIC family chloride channel protein